MFIVILLTWKGYFDTNAVADACHPQSSACSYSLYSPLLKSFILSGGAMPLLDVLSNNHTDAWSCVHESIGQSCSRQQRQGRSPPSPYMVQTMPNRLAAAVKLAWTSRRRHQASKQVSVLPVHNKEMGNGDCDRKKLRCLLK